MRNILLALVTFILGIFSCVHAQNYALDFDGVDDYVNINNVSDDITMGMTLEAWVKAPAVYTNTKKGIVLGVNTSSGGNVIIASIGCNIDNENTFTIYDGGSSAWEGLSNVVVADDNWHHVAYTTDGSTGNLYVDGIFTSNHTVNYNFSSSNQWSIGQEYDSGNAFSDFYEGQIDEIRIWDSVLTKEQINSKMNLVLIGNESGLVGYWRFDEGQGQFVQDLSGNDNEGQLGASIEIDSRDPVWVFSDAPLYYWLNVVGHSPSGYITNSVDHVEVEFNKAVDPSSFSLSDVTLNGPEGLIELNSIEYLNNNIWQINFGLQNASGDYHLYVGPHIEDPNGLEMDQDGNGMGGEDPNDVYDAIFTLFEDPIVFTTDTLIDAGDDSYDANNIIIDGCPASTIISLRDNYFFPLVIISLP